MKMNYKPYSLALLIALPLWLTACASVEQSASFSELHEHRWNLVSINGAAINSNLHSDLEIDAQLKVNGKAGCNRFFGEAKMTGTKVVAANLATTKMACAAEAEEVERAVLLTLMQGAGVHIAAQQLTLKGKEFTLEYQLAP